MKPERRTQTSQRKAPKAIGPSRVAKRSTVSGDSAKAKQSASHSRASPDDFSLLPGTIPETSDCGIAPCDAPSLEHLKPISQPGFHNSETLKVQDNQYVGDTQPFSHPPYEEEAENGAGYGATQDEDEMLRTTQTAQPGDPHYIDFSMIDDLQLQPTGEGGVANGHHPDPLASSSPVHHVQPRFDEFPESQRFTTPHQNSKKRKFDGDMLDDSPALPRNPMLQGSTLKTPSNAMGLSQAFKATQRGSSSVTGPTTLRRALESSDRPTPGGLQVRPLAGASSSPLADRADLRRISEGPQSAFRSQAQDQLERDLLGDEEENTDDAENVSDPENEHALVDQQRELAQRQESLRQPFERLGSISQPVPKRVTRVNVQSLTALVSPSKPRSGSRILRSRRSQSILIEEATQSEEETERAETEPIVSPQPNQSPDEVDDENKENFETHQDVQVSSSQVPETVLRAHTRQQDSLQDSEISPVARLSFETKFEVNGTRVSPRETGHLPPAAEIVVASTQPGEFHSNLVRPIHDSSATHISSSAISHTRNKSSLRQRKNTAGSSTQNASNLSRQTRTDNGDGEADSFQPINRSGEISSPDGEENVSPEESGSDHAPNTIPETASANQAHLRVSSNLQESVDPGYHSSEPLSSSQSQPSAAFLTAQTAQPNASNPIVLPVSPPRRKDRRLLELAAEASPKRGTTQKDLDDVAAFLQDDDIDLLDPIREDSAKSSRQRSDQLKPASLAAPPASNRLDGPRRGHVMSRALPKVSGIRTSPSKKTDDIWEISDSPSQSQATPVDEPIAKKPATTTRPRASTRGKAGRLSVNTTADPEVAENGFSDTADLVSPALSNQSHDDDASVGQDQSIDLGVDSPATREGSSEAGPIVAPNQVFACFNGASIRYYPATCVGKAASQDDSRLRYRVEWDEGSEGEIDEYGIRRLELRVGDAVKVDLKDWPRVPFVVKGFSETVEDGNEGGMTDIYGHSTVLLAPKKRKSLPLLNSTERTREAPITRIYLDMTMFRQFEDRPFTFDLNARPPPQAGVTTPSEPAVPEPPSSAIVSSLHSTPSLRNSRRSGIHASLETSLSALPSAARPGIFSNMAFAISYQEDNRRTSLTNSLIQAGGYLLTSGFDELFISDTPSSSGDNLILRPESSSFNFLALIAEKHSRKTKYVQALALGIPAVSGRWVDACFRAGKLVDWQDYLLAAGECRVLAGAVRSRTLPQLENLGLAEGSSGGIQAMIAQRPNIFASQAVLFVMGKGKQEEQRKPYIFLARAAGASRVEKCMDLKAAKKILGKDRGGVFRWLVVDEREMDLAQNLLKEGGSWQMEWQDEDRLVHVVGTEFLCQSLILGRAMREDEE